MALALENVLEDFGQRATRASDRGTDPATLAAIVSARSDAALTQEVLDAAVASAEKALHEQLKSEHEAALQAQAERHAGEMAEMNARLGEQAGALVAERLREAEENLARQAASATARILAIHLTADVQKRMIDSLGEAIREAVRDSDALRVRVRGPLSLYQALAASLGELSRHLEYAEMPGFDLTVSIDDSLFETRLSDWSAALAEAFS